MDEVVAKTVVPKSETRGFDSWLLHSLITIAGISCTT